MDVSIIIPVFNEAAKVGDDINRWAAFLESSNISGEIIIVDDGSIDNTSDLANIAGNNITAQFKLLRTQLHCGKGAAVKRGICASSGDIVLFADSGSCVPCQNANRGIELIQTSRCDIAHGSRLLDSSNITRRQSWFRRYGSGAFHRVIKMFPETKGLTDTQCGFKIYRGSIARRLYSKVTVEGFVFDIEVIILARREGLVIKEFPIDWSCDPDSRLRVGKKYREIIKEVMYLRKKYLRVQKRQSP